MDPSGIGKKIKELYPQYVNVDDVTLGQKYMQKYGGAVSGIQSGQIQISDIPTEQRAGVSVGLEGVGYKPQTGDAKNLQSATATTTFIKSLEDTYMKAGGGEYEGAGARVSGVKKSIAGVLGLNDPAKVYNDSRAGFAATLKALTGDTGVLTDQDYARLSKLLPTLSSTPGEAQAKFAQLRSQIAAKFGGEESKTGYTAPESKGGLAASVVPGLAQAYKTQQGNVEQYKEGKMGKLELLLKGTPQGILLQKGGAQAAGEVVSALGLASLLKGLGNKIAGLTPKGALANRASVAAEQSATKIVGDDIYKKAEEKILRTVSETDKTAAVKMLKDVKTGLSGKEFNAETILEKLAQYNKAYSTTGAAGKSAKAAVNDALSKAVREELKINMPKVFAAQEQLKTALGLGKNIRRTVGYTSLAAGGAGGLAYLISLLTGGKKN
jgi:hypothetical protein